MSKKQVKVKSIKELNGELSRLSLPEMKPENQTENIKLAREICDALQKLRHT